MLHEISGFGERGLPGLGELLDGRCSFAEVIHRDTLSRLHFIPVGSVPLDAEGLDKEEDGIANVLDALAETYDFVLMSGLPAVETVTTSLAAVHSDAVVLSADPSTAQSAIDISLAGFDSVEHGGPTIFVLRSGKDDSEAVIRGAAA
jgi:Mrp family chromosome partitioning ATPase